MRRLLLLVLVVGCSTATPPPAPQVAVATSHRTAAPATPALPAPPGPAVADQGGLDAIEEQISAQTMFCVAATDCPGGFRCDDGACVAAP